MSDFSNENSKKQQKQVQRRGLNGRFLSRPTTTTPTLAIFTSVTTTPYTPLLASTTATPYTPLRISEREETKAIA